MFFGKFEVHEMFNSLALGVWTRTRDECAWTLFRFEIRDENYVLERLVAKLEARAKSRISVLCPIIITIKLKNVLEQYSSDRFRGSINVYCSSSTQLDDSKARSSGFILDLRISSSQSFCVDSEHRTRIEYSTALGLWATSAA